LYLYTREAHPGYYGKPQTGNIEERQANAKQCDKDLGMTLPWIIDDMKSSIQKAYGGLPYCAYIITCKGKIYYKEAWASAEKLNEHLKKLYESDPKFKSNAAKHVKKKILAEKDSDRRVELGNKLAKLACEDSCKALIDILKKEKKKEVRVKLVKALVHTKQKKCIEYLLTLLGDKEKDIRSATVKILRKLTAENFDFDPEGEDEERAEAIAKWSKWFNDNKEKLAWCEESESFKVQEKKAADN
jgi:hypothetical protein